MTITATMVKELREMTGAGMMDCKTALAESNGDMNAANDWLRKKGISKADKKSGRVAAEGLIGVSAAESKAAVVEINSETDFVARNESFQRLVSTISKIALDLEDVGKLAESPYPGGTMTVSAQIKESIATIGENISLRRAESLTVGQGIVASYVHNSVSDGLGKIGVLVAIESDGETEKLNAFGRQIAMHIAATNPLALNVDQIDPELIVKEKEVYSEQAKASGKPDNIIEKMVEGRMRKFYEEVTLLKQSFVINPDVTVEVAVQEFSKQLGESVKILGFVRFELGAGIEKEETSFAEEVAAVSSS